MPVSKRRFAWIVLTLSLGAVVAEHSHARHETRFAERIRTLFAEVKSALEKGEKTGLEQAETAPKANTAPVLKKPVKKRRAKRNRRATDQQQGRPPAVQQRRGGGPFGRLPLLSPD